MTSWIAENLAMSALLIALVLLLRAPVARLFGARAAFALWLAPLVRLLLPPLGPDAPMPEIFITSHAVAAQVAAPVHAVLPIAAIVLAIWAAGAAVFIVGHSLAYDRFVRRALASGQRLPAAGTSDIDVVATPAVAGPAAAGLIDRRIFVPVNFAATFSPEEQELALRHELLHPRRGDLWVSAAALLVLGLHWFNPLAYVAHRVFRRDLEAACDADLLAATMPAERATYASAIVKCAAGPIPRPLCALTDTDELKGRLKMMTLKHGFAQRLLGSLFALSVVAGGLMLALPAVAQTTTTTTTKDGKTMVQKRELIVKGSDGKERKATAAEMAKMDKCEGQKFEAHFTTPPVNGKIEGRAVVICAKNGKQESKADFAESLQKAIDRIQSDKELDDASKADLIAKMQAKIAELRAGK
jgi:beta-lactamase regulating signal transducer with metallopeptidase domain